MPLFLTLGSAGSFSREGGLFTQLPFQADEAPWPALTLTPSCPLASPFPPSWQKVIGFQGSAGRGPRGEAGRDGAQGPGSPNFALSGPANLVSSCQHHFADSRPPALGLLGGLCSGAPGKDLSVDPTLRSYPTSIHVVFSVLLLPAHPLPLHAYSLDPSNSVPLGSHL